MKLLALIVFSMLFSGATLADDELAPDVTGNQAKFLFDLAVRYPAFKINKNTVRIINLQSGCIYKNDSPVQVQYCAVPNGNMSHQDAIKINQIVMPFLTLRSDTLDLDNLKSAIINYQCVKNDANEFSCWIERH